LKNLAELEAIQPLDSPDTKPIFKSMSTTGN